MISRRSILALAGLGATLAFGSALAQAPSG